MTNGAWKILQNIADTVRIIRHTSEAANSEGLFRKNFGNVIRSRIRFVIRRAMILNKGRKIQAVKTRIKEINNIPVKIYEHIFLDLDTILSSSFDGFIITFAFLNCNKNISKLDKIMLK